MKATYTILGLGLILTGCIAQRPTERIEFTAQELYPEGVTYDKAANVYYVSSERLGTIGKVLPRGGYQPLYSDITLKSTYGLKMHPDGKRLFACVSDANYSKFSTPETKNKMMRLISIDVATGKKIDDIDLSKLADGKHFANDLVFDNKGNAYVTDSYADMIYKVDVTGKASVFCKSELFKTEGISVNGIVFHPDGFLLVVASGTGAIYKVDVNNPQNVQKVMIKQFFIGGDGLVLNDNNKLTVVVNGGTDKIFQLKTDDNWTSARLFATTLLADRFSYPTTATVVDNEVWVVNAKSNELNDSNAFPAKIFAIQRAILKPIPKKVSE